MRSFNFGTDEVHVSNVTTRDEIKTSIREILCIYEELLPDDREDLILIKPNFHKDRNALIGNTTDFRILADLIEELQRRGYTNIVIGEGPACGWGYRDINVFERLRVDKLARFYGVKLIDLNDEEVDFIELKLFDGLKVRCAKICVDAAMFINIPKLKTHQLSDLSVCLKSTIGCIQRMDKRKLHSNLVDHIICINKFVKPELQIVDALISMEGQGPGRGTPVEINNIVTGTNPFHVEMVCGKLSGYNPEEMKLIKKAIQYKLIKKTDFNIVNSVKPVKIFRRAKHNLLVRILESNKPVRLRSMIRPIFNLKFISMALYYLKLREDRFDNSNDKAKINFEFNDKYCQSCKKCIQYCPTQCIRPHENNVNLDQCIECLYCYFVCPKEHINLTGKLGYLDYLIKKYKHLTGKFASASC